MNISAVSNLSLNVLLSNGNNTGAGNAGQVSSDAPQDSTSDISPAARFLSRLQQLEQADPARFQQVVSNAVQLLHARAADAQKNGNTAQADRLNTLADQFQSAAANGQTPTLQDLRQAGVSGRHHHGHHHDGDHHGSQQAGQAGQNGPQNDPTAAFQPPSDDSDTHILLSIVFSSTTIENTPATQNG